jgi:type IV secretory pathway VirB4 component
VISGRASTVEELHRILVQIGPDPAHWLPVFQSSQP